MAIRAASETDAEALLPLMRGYCEFYGAEPDDAGLRAMIRCLVTEPDFRGYLLVATDADGVVVGFAACGWKWSSLRGARIVVLEDLFVAPEARGHGHGGALVEEAATLARRHGAPVLTWLTAPDNATARAVYDRAGASAEAFLEYELEL